MIPLTLPPRNHAYLFIIPASDFQSNTFIALRLMISGVFIPPPRGRKSTGRVTWNVARPWPILSFCRRHGSVTPTADYTAPAPFRLLTKYSAGTASRRCRNGSGLDKQRHGVPCPGVDLPRIAEARQRFRRRAFRRMPMLFKALYSIVNISCRVISFSGTYRFPPTPADMPSRFAAAR